MPVEKCKFWLILNNQSVQSAAFSDTNYWRLKLGLRAASLSLLVSVTTTDREYKLRDGRQSITCWPGFLRSCRYWWLCSDAAPRACRCPGVTCWHGGAGGHKPHPGGAGHVWWQCCLQLYSNKPELRLPDPRPGCKWLLWSVIVRLVLITGDMQVPSSYLTLAWFLPAALHIKRRNQYFVTATCLE